MENLKITLLFAIVVFLILITGFVQSWNTALLILNMGLISAIMSLGVNLQWGFAGLFNVGIIQRLRLHVHVQEFVVLVYVQCSCKDLSYWNNIQWASTHRSIMDYLSHHQWSRANSEWPLEVIHYSAPGMKKVWTCDQEWPFLWWKKSIGLSYS